MEKIAKFIRKLSATEQRVIASLLTALINESYEGLDIKKLKGYTDVYRARKGDLRVIFQKRTGDVRILEISRRSERTYKNL